jgi:hypothetical protein
MKNILMGASCIVVLGIGLFVGASSVSALPALPHVGVGCFVKVADTGDPDVDYVFDESCKAVAVLKRDGGGVAWFMYQDHGQLRTDATLPSSTVQYEYEMCLNFGPQLLCGRTQETVTPSGEYKSTFKARAD